MKNISFKKKLIVSTIGTYALAGLSGVVMAQDTQQDNQMVAEEVVVTGIRGSLMRAMDIKRDSQGVVDAISAEDIGKFPDSNLAESLQRITGVSIDRANGEGSKVTVRGFGPDYNLITLNGRQMPGATIGGTFASGSRSFDFSNLAAESVSAVEVYKTVRAENPVGGLGATINIKTARPLDNPGLQFSAGVKGVYDDSAQDPSVTPEVSGIYSQTFADDKFGVGLSLIYQDREGGSANAQIGTGWRMFPKPDMWGAVDFAAPAPSDHTNPPEAEDVYGVPQQIGYNFSEYERTRLNGQLVLQFAPTDDLTATLDYTYSRKEETTVFSDTGAWFNFTGAKVTEYTDNGTGVVESPLIYREMEQWNTATNLGGDFTFGSGRYSAQNENTSIGLNVEWSASDRLSFKFDAHLSDAESKPDGPYGNNNVLTTSAFVRNASGVHMGEGDLPVMWLDIIDGSGGSDLRIEDLQITGSSFRNSQMLHEIDQFQFQGEFELSDSMSLDFGVGHIAQSNRSTIAVNQRDTWGGLGVAGQVPVDAYSLTDIGSYFDGVSGSESEFLFDRRFTADFDQVVAFAVANLDDGAGFADCANGSTWYCASTTPDEIRYIEEDSTSAWVQYNLETEVIGMPTSVAAGLRYEDTTTKGYGTDLTKQFSGEVAWIGANELYLQTVANPDLTLIEQGEGSYDYFLPSVDVSVDVLDDLVVRASLGRSLGRPLWNQLSGLTLSRRVNPAQGDPNAATGAGNLGNVALKPMVSDNFDLSVEWYYGDASYVSIGYYQKKVKDFIGTQVNAYEFVDFDMPNPSAGDRRDAAIAAGVDQWNAAAVKEWIVNNATEGVDLTTTPPRVNGIAGQDPNVRFNITEYVNQEDAKFDGFEFAVQHNFGETGLGVIANYTIADSDTSYDDTELVAPQFALTGLSDTANLVAFYDKYGVQVRLSYNWRDEFLFTTATGTGANPGYTEAYQQFDLNASYDLTDNLTIFAEGVNITDEYSRNHARSEIMATAVSVGGPRYALGARYTF